MLSGTIYIPTVDEWPEDGDKFGFIGPLSTSVTIGNPATWVDLWSYGGQRTSPTGTFTPFMASDNSADTNIPVTWTYLDASGYEQTMTASTNAADGTIPVSLGVVGQESFRGFISGSTDIAGDITLTTANNFTAGVPNAQSEVLAHIPQYDNQTQLCARRIPIDKRVKVTKINITLSRINGSAGSAQAVFQTRAPGGTWLTKRRYQVSTTSAINKDANITLEPLSDFRVRIRDISDSNSYVSGDIIFIQQDA